MVEFQRKLQDNKFAEWSEHYMNYAALKHILKKAKKAREKYHHFKKIRRAESKELDMSSRNLEDDDGISTINSVPTIHSQDDFASVATEDTALISRCKKSEDDLSRFSVRNALGSLRSISGMFSVDIENRNSRRMEESLREMEDNVHAFDLLFRDEQKKVESFYYDTLDDLEEKLEFVKSSVAKAFGIRIDETSGNFIESSPAPGIRKASPFASQQKIHRKVYSMGDVVNMDEVMKDFRYTNNGGNRHNKSQNEKSYDSDSYNQKKTTTIEVATKCNFEDKQRSSKRSTKKYHKRGVSNIRLGHLLQDDGDDDDEELKFQSADANGKIEPELEEKRSADAAMIKRFLVSNYRLAKFLHNFAMLNITGFVKIAKKFDKTIPQHAGKFKSALGPRNTMDDGEDVEKLAKRFESYYANWFCEGDIREAKVQMLSKQGDELEMDWSQLRLGYRMGICAVLAIWVCWDCIWGLIKNGDSTIGERSAFPIFRACGGLLLLQWYWGCSVFIWTRYRINYIFLFDFIPKTISTSFDIFCAAVDNTLIFMLLTLLYYKAGAHEIPDIISADVYPLILILITTYKLIFPIAQRRLMWHTVYKVVTAPLHSPTFFHTYVGDIFTSMVKVFQDIVWSIAWLSAGSFVKPGDTSEENCCHGFWFKKILIPLVTMLPLVIRFNQCLRKFWDCGDRFPHLANASKYALSSLVTLFGIFHPLYLEYNHASEDTRIYQVFWTFIFVLSSLFSYGWDVYMDWGLGRPKYFFLNQPLMFPSRSYYYFTIAIDLALRFLWVLTLVPPNSGASFALPEYLTALSMMLELSRRTLWGFFRLENEHRTNENTNRRNGFVPLHFNSGHVHKYKNQNQRAGTEVLRELILVTFVVGGFCFATIAAAHRANQRVALLNSDKEL